MTRRLVAFALLVCAAAVVALVVPLTIAARDAARADALTGAETRAEAAAELVASSAGADVAAVLQAAPTEPGELTVVLPDDSTVGAPLPADSDAAVAAARAGRAISVASGSSVLVVSPAPTPAGTSAVVVRLTAAELRAGLGRSLLTLGATGLLLLGTAAGSAVVLARRTAAPLRDVASVADQLADGRLDVRAPTEGVPEVAAVGRALNRLTGRVDDLLAEERRAAGDLAHRLRTPLTALAVDLDGVRDPEVRARLREDLDAVQASVDEIITAARRPEREGTVVRCDAVEVVSARVAFWSVLAEDQGRALSVWYAPGPLPVKAAAEDLGTVVDIALQNVFLHTPEGTAVSVAVTPRQGGGALLVVDDAGAGWGSSPADGGVGSTGLGLDIAVRTAEASGGRLSRDTSPSGGARLVVELGPPDE